MTAGALLDSSSEAPLYHNINKGKLFFVEIIGVQRMYTIQDAFRLFLNP